MWVWAGLAGLGGLAWWARRRGWAGRLLLVPVLLLVYLPPLFLLAFSGLLNPDVWEAWAFHWADTLPFLTGVPHPVWILLGWRGELLWIHLRLLSRSQALLGPALGRFLPALPAQLFGGAAARCLETVLGWGWCGRQLLRLLPGASGLTNCALSWAAGDPVPRRFPRLVSLLADLRGLKDTMPRLTWPHLRDPARAIKGTTVNNVFTVWLWEQGSRQLLCATRRALRSRRLPVPLDADLDSALCHALECVLDCLSGLRPHRLEWLSGGWEWLGPVLGSFTRLLRQPGAASPRLRRHIHLAAGSLGDWFEDKVSASGDSLRVPALEGVRRAALSAVRRPAGEAAESLQGALTRLLPSGSLAKSFGRRGRRRLLRSVLALLARPELDLRWHLGAWARWPEVCLPTELRRVPGALAALVGQVRGGAAWEAEWLLHWLALSHVWGAVWSAHWPNAPVEPLDEQAFAVACERAGVYPALVEGCRAVLARAPPLVPDFRSVFLQGPPVSMLQQPYCRLRSLLNRVQRFLSCQEPRLADRRRVALGELRVAGLGALVAELRTAASAWPRTVFWAAELGGLAAALRPAASRAPADLSWPLDDAEAAERAYFSRRGPNVPLKLRWDLHQPLARPDHTPPTPQPLARPDAD